MTPRELLWQWLSDEQIEDFLAGAKANGLFIGPLVATPEMAEAGQDFRTSKGVLVTMTGAASWKAMVAEWQRGEGA